jgi:hypothetical protein
VREEHSITRLSPACSCARFYAQRILLRRRLGRSSASYEIGIFAAGSEEASALATFVHVYVNANGKPIRVADTIREVLSPLVPAPDEVG